MAANVPFPSKASLVQQYVGKSLKDIPLPAAVLDIASVKRNCKRMLDAVGELGWELRVGVASHKVGERFLFLLGFGI
jgi:D-serine deaminase-like pyridoxal phosphate-dependent protein